MDKETKKALKSIAFAAQGIVDTAGLFENPVTKDIEDCLLVDLRAKFDLLESAMLEI